jgi:hypothetical protein
MGRDSVEPCALPGGAWERGFTLSARFQALRGNANVSLFRLRRDQCSWIPAFAGMTFGVTGASDCERRATSDERRATTLHVVGRDSVEPANAWFGLRDAARCRPLQMRLLTHPVVAADVPSAVKWTRRLYSTACETQAATNAVPSNALNRLAEPGYRELHLTAASWWGETPSSRVRSQAEPGSESSCGGARLHQAAV